jgi:phenylalanyl-tRNA synthetase beta chain
MGGDATAVSDDTQNIYVEAAFWWPGAIAGRSRRFNFSTDAGHRFERGVDPSQTVEHIERITQLIIDICGTTNTACGPIDDQPVNLPVVRAVTLRVARASKVIGMVLTQEQCADALTRLGLALAQTEGSITVMPPSYRFDLQIEEDLIEEVARLVGYNNLPQTPPLAPITAKIRPEALRSEFAVRRAIAAMGYQETINFSFVDERWEHELCANPNPIKLLNPIASQMSVMRSSLLGSLLQVLKFNLDRKVQRLRVFEVGRVFLRDAAVKNTDTTVEGLRQPMRVAGLVYGDAEALQWGRKERDADFFDVKGDVETLLAPRQPIFTPAEHPAMHPGRCAAIVLDGVAIGFVGELHPRWRQSYGLAQAPLMFELELDPLLQREVPVFKAVAKHQAVERDIAVLVSEKVTHTALMSAIWAASTEGLLCKATLFDIYRPKPGKDANPATPASLDKSMAVRLTLNSEELTLSEQQIENAVQTVIISLADTLGARQRI